MELFKYEPGDVLVQCGGEPWPTLSWIFTGWAFPHASLVTRVEPCAVLFTGQQVWIVENSYDGIKEKELVNPDLYEVWRPLCGDETKAKAIAWARGHVGEAYGYNRLMEIVVGYRVGLRPRPGMDDDASQDGRRKVCSETIAMAYYRSGYDLVPMVQDVDTMPWNLRNRERLVPVWVPTSSPLYRARPRFTS